MSSLKAFIEKINRSAQEKIFTIEIVTKDLYADYIKNIFKNKITSQ